MSFLGNGVEVDARDEGDAKPAKKGRAGMSFLGRGAEVDSDGNVKTLSQTFQSEADEDVALLSQLDATQEKPV